MTNALITTGHIDFANQDVVKTLQATVAKGTTPEEFTIFAHFCKSTGLNPLKKEVWCIKTNQGLQIMTGLNGYREIANRHPEFDGLEGPDYTYDAEGRLTGCEVRVYRKDRSRPAKGVAILSEVMGQSPVWKQRTHQMLNKCAEVDAYRKAFPSELNGTYAEEEMPEKFGEVDVTPAHVRPQPETKAPAPELLEIASLAKEMKAKGGDFASFCSAVLDRPIKSGKDINPGEYQKVMGAAIDEIERLSIEEVAA